MEAEALLRVERLITRYQGPIPPASEFTAYEAAHSGAANRILGMAEREQDNMFELNKTLIRREGNLRIDGQRFALASLLAMLIVTSACILTGHDIAGTALGVGTIIAVVAMFLRQQAIVKNGDGEIRVGDNNEDN